MDLAFAAEQYAQAQSVAAAVAQYYANAANAAAMNAINAAAEQGHQVQVISKRFSNVLYDIFGNKTTRSYFWAVTNPVIFGKKTTRSTQSYFIYFWDVTKSYYFRQYYLAVIFL